jgi:hypothetical protein
MEIVGNVSGKRSDVLISSREVGQLNVIYGDLIIEALSAYNLGYTRTYSIKDIHTDIQGYRYLDEVAWSKDPRFTEKKQRTLILSGGGFFLRFDYSLSDRRQYRISSEFAPQEKLRGSLPEQYAFVDDGVKSVAAWSELTESLRGQSIKYSATGLKAAFIYEPAEYWIELNQIDFPWAEGVPGPGIGGTIDLEFTRPTKEIDILNGYVDLAKRNLYKENNRLKTIRVDSENPKFSTEYTFEDVVKFHGVILPKATTQVRITILDVYEGTKFDDTCITKIFIPQRELRPRSEYEAEIIKALKNAGYLK